MCLGVSSKKLECLSCVGFWFEGEFINDEKEIEAIEFPTDKEFLDSESCFSGRNLLNTAVSKLSCLLSQGLLGTTEEKDAVDDQERGCGSYKVEVLNGIAGSKSFKVNHEV